MSDARTAAEADIQALAIELDMASQEVYRAQTPRQKEIADKKYAEVSEAKDRAFEHLKNVIDQEQRGIDLAWLEKEKTKLWKLVPPIEKAVLEFHVAEAILAEKRKAAEAAWVPYGKAAAHYVGTLPPLGQGQEPRPGQLPRTLELFSRELKKRAGQKLPSLLNAIMPRDQFGVTWDDRQAITEAFDAQNATASANEQAYRDHSGFLSEDERAKLFKLLTDFGSTPEGNVAASSSLGLNEQVTYEELLYISRTGSHPSIDIARIAQNLDGALKRAEVRVYGSPQMREIAEDHVRQGYPALSQRIRVQE